jgi:hypothetical protein
MPRFVSRHSLATFQCQLVSWSQIRALGRNCAYSSKSFNGSWFEGLHDTPREHAICEWMTILWVCNIPHVISRSERKLGGRATMSPNLLVCGCYCHRTLPCSLSVDPRTAIYGRILLTCGLQVPSQTCMHSHVCGWSSDLPRSTATMAITFLNGNRYKLSYDRTIASRCQAHEAVAGTQAYP